MGGGVISISIFQINGSAHRNSTSGFRCCLLAAFGWFQGTHTPNFRQLSPSVTESKLLPVYFKYDCHERFLLPICHVTTSSVAEFHLLPADQILYQYHNRRRSFVFQINWSSTTELYFRFPFLCLGCIWVVRRYPHAKFQANVFIRHWVKTTSGLF